jgi:hypothetical protein
MIPEMRKHLGSRVWAWLVRLSAVALAVVLLVTIVEGPAKFWSIFVGSAADHEQAPPGQNVGPGSVVVTGTVRGPVIGTQNNTSTENRSFSNTVKYSSRTVKNYGGPANDGDYMRAPSPKYDPIWNEQREIVLGYAREWADKNGYSSSEAPTVLDKATPYINLQLLRRHIGWFLSPKFRTTLGFPQISSPSQSIIEPSTSSVTPSVRPLNRYPGAPYSHVINFQFLISTGYPPPSNVTFFVTGPYISTVVGFGVGKPLFKGRTDEGYYIGFANPRTGDWSLQVFLENDIPKDTEDQIQSEHIHYLARAVFDWKG